MRKSPQLWTSLSVQGWFKLIGYETKLNDNDNFSVIVMILSMSPSLALSRADDSAREIILVKCCAGMIVVNAISRSSMCSSLAAITKNQFHGEISKLKYIYWSTEGPLITPAGNSTRSKMFFAISRWRKICPRASILLSSRVVKTHPFIFALLVVTGLWSVARKYAVFVVTNARMRTRSRKMANLYEPSIDSILAKNVYTAVTHAERNALALTNIQRGAWKIVDNPASMQNVIYVVRSPVLLVRNHADGQHPFLP